MREKFVWDASVQGLRPWAEVAEARRARALKNAIIAEMKRTRALKNAIIAEMQKTEWDVTEIDDAMDELASAAMVAVENFSPSSLPAPMIISDHLDGVKNPVDGKLYDSKSEYYRAVKAAGCEIVGNDMPIKPYPSPDVKAEEVNAALAKVKQGYKPEIEFEAIDD